MEELLALDRASVRRIDQDGHLHIAVSNFSRATVSPYLGRDIPDYQHLGLQDGKVYQLLRPAAELQRGAPTFDGKPLLLIHKPLSAEDHPREITVGSIANDVRFEDPWLRGALTVWDQEAIDGINDGSLKHLSCGYRYVPVMTPGVFEGQRYDGVMTHILGNHIALVEEPRVPGAVVGDAALRMEITPMPLAITAERREQIANVIHGYTRDSHGGTLALDATIEQLNELLGNLEPSAAAGAVPGVPGVPGALPGEVPPPGALPPPGDVPGAVAPLPGEPMSTLAPPPDELTDAAPGDPAAPPGVPGAPPEGAPPAEGASGSPKMAALLQLLEANLSPEVMAQVRQMAGEIAAEGAGGAEAPPTDPSAPEEGGVADPPSQEPPSEPDDTKTEDEMPPQFSKPAKDAFPKAGVPPAMDAAQIEARLWRRMHDVTDALRAVRPVVGDLNRRFETPADVYAFALDAVGVSTKDIHPSAFPAMLALVRKHEEAPAPRVAMDAAQAKQFSDSFGPNFHRLKQA